MPYLRRTYRLAADLEDLLVADLWEAGTLGVSSESEPLGAVRLVAYFEMPTAAAPLPPLPPLPPGVELLSEDEMPEIDWMAEYRQKARPFLLGGRLVVDPREPEDVDPGAANAANAANAAGGAGIEGPAEVPAGRRLLRLPARTAFGIGSHESTALALALLERLDLAGRAVLDVGTGTGILAFAALLWGAARAVGFDIDPVAAFQARVNARLNALRLPLFAGRPAALAAQLPAGLRFDLAVVNVIPEQILPDLAALLAALAPAADLILSGLLAERAAEVLAHFAAVDFAEADRCQAGDWVALRLTRPAR
jgi:ribosomal protein L11 methyltransferase